MNRKSCFVAFAMLLCAAATASADWSDDFSGDAFHVPWVFFDNGGSSPPDATTVSPTGELLFFEGNAALFPANFDQFAVGVGGFFNPAYVLSDVRLRADVTATANITLAGGFGLGNNDSFILTRVGANGTDSYLLALDFFDGGVDLLRVDPGPTLVGLSSTGIGPFDPNGTYTLELIAQGSNISGNVYNAITSDLVASLSAMDATYASGWSGLGTAINDNGSIGPGGSGRTLHAAAFDNVEARALPIPEPSTLALAGFALAGLAAAAWRRHRG